MSKNIHSDNISAPLTHATYSLKDILGDTIPREEALTSLNADPEASEIYHKELTREQQEHILNFIQGNWGLQIIEFRKKPKELLTMYSEVLKQMDKNTEYYMIDRMAEEIKTKDAEIEALKTEIAVLIAENTKYLNS